MNTILNTSSSISQVGAWVSGCILLGTSVLITVEVILRKLFTLSLGGADEISGYALAASCSWAFAYALFKKAHIRIDVLYVKFPQIVRNILDIASLILFGIYMSVLSYYAFEVFLISWSKNSTANTPLHTPLWIPQLIWALGLISCALAIYILLFATVSHLLRGDFNKMRQLSNPTTLEEEIEEGTIGVDAAKEELAGGRA